MPLPPSFRALSILLTTALLAACSSSPDAGVDLHRAEPSQCEVPGSSFGIVGGSVLAPDNDLSSSTVMVVHVKKNNEVNLCTGTLIDSDKVLSAAHCTTKDGKRTVIAFTNNAACLSQAPKRTLRLVSAQAVHPDYLQDEFAFTNAAADLAVFKFKGDIPEGYRIRELPSPHDEVQAEDTLVMTGYGSTIEGGDDSGTLRFTTTSAQNILNEFYINLSKQRVAIPGTWAVEQPQKGVCTGDSGGPLYAQKGSRLTLIGITSMGIDHRTTDEKKLRNCHGVAVFTDIRAQLDWILKQKRAL